MQDVGVGGAGRLQRARPRGDVVLDGGVVERGEDAVGRVRAVLVGGVQRRLGEHRVGALERARHVDRPHVEAA